MADTDPAQRVRMRLNTRERTSLGSEPQVTTRDRKALVGGDPAMLLSRWDRIRWRLGLMSEEEFIIKKKLADRVRILAGGNTIRRVR